MVNVLPRLTEGAVVVIPADRTEVLLAALLANASGTFPSIAGIVLNGPFPLPEDINRLIDGLGPTVPIITTDLGTYDTAVRVMNTACCCGLNVALVAPGMLVPLRRH